MKFQVREKVLTVLLTHVLSAPMEGTSTRECTCGTICNPRYKRFEDHLIVELMKAGVLVDELPPEAECPDVSGGGVPYPPSEDRLAADR